MNQLRNLYRRAGGSTAQVRGYSARCYKKRRAGLLMLLYNEVGRRFRSMLEVGRFLHLITDAGRGAVRRKWGE
jgi:hypothetical protein